MKGISEEAVKELRNACERGTISPVALERHRKALERRGLIDREGKPTKKGREVL